MRALGARLSDKLPTIRCMRFDTPNKPPLAPVVRWILWSVTLVPTLLVMLWLAKQAGLPKPDPAAVGRTPEETKRLKRILNQPREQQSSPLSDEAVRVVASTTAGSVDESTASDDRTDARLDK